MAKRAQSAGKIFNFLKNQYGFRKSHYGVTLYALEPQQHGLHFEDMQKNLVFTTMCNPTVHPPTVSLALHWSISERCQEISAVSYTESRA